MSSVKTSGFDSSGMKCFRYAAEPKDIGSLAALDISTFDLILGEQLGRRHGCKARMHVCLVS